MTLDWETSIAIKHGLYWSRSWVEDDDGQILVDTFYLYDPERASMLFFPLFDRLRQLNDYCFSQLVSSEQKLAELMVQRDAAMAQRYGGGEELAYLADEIPLWEHNVAVIAKANPIILLCSFVEWGLKEVVKDICGLVQNKTGKNISDFEFYVNFLKKECALDLNIEEYVIEQINAFRRVRNSFAHGKWNLLEGELADISLRSCFDVVSTLFEKIEKAAWNSPWGTVTS